MLEYKPTPFDCPLNAFAHDEEEEEGGGGGGGGGCDQTSRGSTGS